MARIDPQLKLRLPVELKAQVEVCAQRSKRSLNAEIVRRLEWTLNDGRNSYEVDGPDYPDRLRELGNPQQYLFPSSRYAEEDFPDAPESNEDLTIDERALLDTWRAISEEDRGALRIALRNARIVSGQRRD